MERSLVKFINHLRRGGIRVTLAETIDCFRSLQLVGLKKDRFYSLLKATLVKDEAYAKTFDRLFKHYFSQYYFEHHSKEINLSKEDISILQKIAQAQGENLDLQIFGSDNQVGFGNGQGGGRRGSITGENFVLLIKLGGPDDFRKAIQEGINNLGDLSEKYISDREEAVREVKVFLEWKMGEFVLEKQFSEVNEHTVLEWKDKLFQMDEILEEELELALMKKFGEKAMEEFLTRSNLNQLDFYQLNHEQIQEMKKKITKLAHRLSTRVSARWHRAKRGKVDIQRTIRKSMATGGQPINLSFRGKRPSKPEIVILCDVSGSVKVFSEFMLQFVYSLQSRFIHVRSFAFVDTTDEITDYFRNTEISDGIREMYNQSKFSKTGFSDYGQAFVSFITKYPEAVTSKTSIIILGDGRNNYQPPELEAFHKITSTGKRVVWLNPETIDNWNKEDSIINKFSPFCNQLLECRNLNQLDMVIRKIF